MRLKRPPLVRYSHPVWSLIVTYVLFARHPLSMIHQHGVAVRATVKYKMTCTNGSYDAHWHQCKYYIINSYHSHHMHMVNSTDAVKGGFSIIPMNPSYFFQDWGVHFRAIVQPIHEKQQYVIYWNKSNIDKEYDAILLLGMINLIQFIWFPFGSVNQVISMYDQYQKLCALSVYFLINWNVKRYII